MCRALTDKATCMITQDLKYRHINPYSLIRTFLNAVFQSTDPEEYMVFAIRVFSDRTVSILICMCSNSIVNLLDLPRRPF